VTQMNSYHVAVASHSPVVETVETYIGALGKLASHHSTSTSDSCEAACHLDKEKRKRETMRNKERIKEGKRDSMVDYLKERVTRQPLFNTAPRKDDRKLEQASLLASLREYVRYFLGKVTIFPIEAVSECADTEAINPTCPLQPVDPPHVSSNVRDR